MKFNIGDRVRIKSHDKIVSIYDKRAVTISFIPDMKVFCNTTCLIEDEYRHDTFWLSGPKGINSFVWHESWLEPVVTKIDLPETLFTLD